MQTQHNNTLQGHDCLSSPTQPQYQTILYCQGSTLEVQLLPPELLLGYGYCKAWRDRTEGYLHQPTATVRQWNILFCNKSS
ncbi:hypothetical protein ACB092_05G088700 [Castanea dentata]